MRTRSYAAAILALAVSTPSDAQTAEHAEATEKTVDKPAAETNDTKNPWPDFKLGAGLSFTLDIGDLDRISKAMIVDNVVRVTDQDNGRARIMFEGHKFWSIASGKIGIGPFVAVQPGSKDIIDAFGMGLMVGFRRGDSDDSFNIGFGVVVDPNTQVLGDGFVANRPPPGQEKEVRYRETMQTGLFVITSFAF